MMVIGGDQGHIILEFVDIIPSHLPCATDVCCSVEASCGGFGGRDEAVWFSRDNIEHFLADLRQLEGTRHGEAVLTDYSYGSEYDGVRIGLFTVDGWGHVAVRAEIRKSNRDHHSLSKQVAVVEFELRADCFVAVVEDFQAMLAPARSSPGEAARTQQL